MKILLATFSLVTLALLAAPTGRAQFVPGPNPIAGTVTAAQTLPSGAGVISSTGDLEVSGSSVAITVTGTSSIRNDGVINQTGTGRAIRDNTGGLTLTVTNSAGALLQAADADAIQMNRSNSSISFDNYGSVISLNVSAGGAQAIDWNVITTGSGTIGGAVTIGGGSGGGALAPGAHPQQEATLAIQGSLTFQTGGTYLYSFNANRNNSKADEVIANGVTIAGGATLTADGKIGGRLREGTTFTVISNTAATPIAGTFANLPDGSIITIHGNNLQASYEGGGDGNDLTLTVVR